MLLPHRLAMSAIDLRRFIYCVLIWGTTWLAITFQLGAVAPEASVAWRFGLSALILAGICRWRGLPMRFSWRVHLHLYGFGVTMFGVGYVCVYYAESHVASGLVAVGYSVLPLTNQLGARLAMGTPMSRRVSIGGAIGLFGVVCVFWPELAGLKPGRDVVLGALFTAGGVLASTAGNVWASQLEREGVGVLQKMAWGMAYGTATSLLAALVAGVPLGFDASPAYLLSLLYLALFGSVAAFFFYLKLLENVGGGRAGYIGVMTTVVALVLSSLFENFHWTPISLLGLGAAIVGNLFILKR